MEFPILAGCRDFSKIAGLSIPEFGTLLMTFFADSGLCDVVKGPEFVELLKVSLSLYKNAPRNPRQLSRRCLTCVFREFTDTGPS